MTAITFVVVVIGGSFAGAIRQQERPHWNLSGAVVHLGSGVAVRSFYSSFIHSFFAKISGKCKVLR